MDIKRLEKLLHEIKEGKCTVHEAVEQLRILPYEDLDFATIDNHRSIRIGSPEVIFGEGKSLEQLISIIKRYDLREENLLATRIDDDRARSLLNSFPNAEYLPTARTFTLIKKGLRKHGGRVGILTAGASDLPVAEEAAVTANVLGSEVQKFIDIGVSGLHRLLHRINEIRGLDVLIVVAGMEGALPSVVGGLVGLPIIAVPTSVGYGAAFEGLAALLGMLNSCAAGVTVVNIDNGFGAGYAANLIAKGKHARSSL